MKSKTNKKKSQEKIIDKYLDAKPKERKVSMSLSMTGLAAALKALRHPARLRNSAKGVAGAGRTAAARLRRGRFQLTGIDLQDRSGYQFRVFGQSLQV
jgi:hypothetical protein